MIKKTLIVFSLVAIFLIGTWTKFLRDENQRLKRNTADLERQLATDRANYTQLYDNYEHEKLLAKDKPQPAGGEARLKPMQSGRAALKERNPRGPEVDSHISEDKAQIAKLESQLSGLNADGTAVNRRSNAYRASQKKELSAQRQELNAQLKQIQTAIVQIQNQIRQTNANKQDPNRLENLSELKNQLASAKDQRSQLQQQIKNLGAMEGSTNQAVNREVVDEQTEIQGEKEDLRRQLERLRSDLKYWQKQKSGPGLQ